MGTMTVKPAEGRKIRRPDTGVEITEPIIVDEHDGFYIRCIQNGDLVREESQDTQFKEKPSDQDDSKQPGNPPKKPESKTKGGDQ